MRIRPTPRRSAAPPRWCRRRSSAATAPRPRRSRRRWWHRASRRRSAPEHRRFLAAEQEALDQPALVAAGDQEAAQPGDALDQRLPAGLAAQPVAAWRPDRPPGCRAARAGPRSRAATASGSAEAVAITPTGVRHAAARSSARIADRRPQRAAQQHQPAGARRARPVGHGRPARGCGSTRHCWPGGRCEPQIEVQRGHPHALVGVLDQRLGAPAAAELDRDLGAAGMVVGPGASRCDRRWGRPRPAGPGSRGWCSRRRPACRPASAPGSSARAARTGRLAGPGCALKVARSRLSPRSR